MPSGAGISATNEPNAASSISQISTSIAPGPVPSKTRPGFGGVVPGRRKGGIRQRCGSSPEKLALRSVSWPVERLARQMRADDRDLNGLLFRRAYGDRQRRRRAPSAWRRV